jgi:hypothetical protein
MRRATPPLPNTPSWRGVQLKHRDNFTFYINIFIEKETDMSRFVQTTQNTIRGVRTVPEGRKPHDGD